MRWWIGCAVAISLLLVGVSLRPLPVSALSGGVTTKYAWNNYGYRIDVYHHNALTGRTKTSLNGSFAIPSLPKGSGELFVFNDEYCLGSVPLVYTGQPLVLYQTVPARWKIDGLAIIDFLFVLIMLGFSWKLFQRYPTATLVLVVGLVLLNGMEFFQMLIAGLGFERAAGTIFPLKYVGVILAPLGFFGFVARGRIPRWILLAVVPEIVLAVSWMWLGGDVAFQTIWGFSFDFLRSVLVCQSVTIFIFCGGWLFGKTEKDQERNRLLLVGLIGYVLFLCFFVLIPLTLFHGREPLGISYTLISGMSGLFVVILLWYVLIQKQIIPVRQLVRGSVLYGTVTIGLSSMYALGILTLNRFAGDRTGLLDMYLFFLLVVLAFPTRDRLQKIIDNHFFGDPQKELEQTGRLAAVGTLAAGLAHEIKNPLAVINTMITLLPERISEKKFQKELLEMVPRQLDRINGLIHELLSLAKPSTIDMKPTSIAAVLEKAGKLLAIPAKKKGVRVVIRAEAGTVPADEKALEQVILNLGLNALDAMPDGGVLTLSWKNKKKWLEVRDTGCGMDKDTQEQMFDPFFTTKANGTGLGLSIVRRIVTAHQATLTVFSKPAHGTTIRINFGRRIV